MLGDLAQQVADVPYHRPGESGYRRLVVALFAASVATFAALYSTQPLIGTLAQYFRIPAAQAVWSVSAATLLLGVGMLVAGPLSDRLGRTVVIKGSLVGTVLLGVAGALARSWPWLLAARAAQGLALAGMPAVALVYLREEVHAPIHPRATGLYIGGTALGGMTGRLLAGAIADLAGWRAGLGSVAALGAGCALVVMVALPQARHGPVPGGEPGTREQPSWSAATPVRSAVPRNATQRALADRFLVGLYVIAGAATGAFVAVYNVLGLRLTTGPYHLSVFAASLVFCVYPLGSVGASAAGHLAEHIGRPPVVLGGCLLAAAGVAITLCSPLPLIVAGVAILTIGFFAAHGVASGWATALGQQRRAVSQASALYLLAYYLGSSIFGALGTSIWGSDHWPGVAAMATVLLLLAAVIATTGTARQRHTRTSPELVAQSPSRPV